MARKKKDMSEVLIEKAAARSEAMEATKAHIEEASASPIPEADQDTPLTTTEKPGRGRPVEDPNDPKKAVTINLRASSHKKLKMFAVMNDTNASALIEQWIDEHCVG